jgi:ABC-type amino acid transport substrate-binding protein
MLAVLGACVASVCAAAPACPQLLRIGFSDTPTPPGLLGQGEQFADPPGWEVLAVRDAIKRLGCSGELLRLPVRRVDALLAQGGLDFALLYGVTAERLQTYRFPLDAGGRPDVAWAPAFGSVALFAPAGTSPEPGFDGRRLSPRWRVGVIAGSVHEALARERGWQVVPLTVQDAAVAMLQAGRFDLLLVTRETLSPKQLANVTEWTPMVARLPYFMPASTEFARRHPQWARRFWQEFCRASRRHEPQARPVDCGIEPAAALR